ncbi:HAMP domain-containing histidine kinase [Erysipelotrichaceae bacterium OttesenSCG-928-M19]|nr:HAMP domain-containing histidine kinase [Erysipelotrichaceae bacterium OttesenSCG-928-M19]
MKIHTRFFITFFCFALFFSISSYLAQDSIFKHNQSAEEAKIAQQVVTIKDSLENNPDFLYTYLTSNDIGLDVVSYNEETKKVDKIPYNNKISEISKYVLNDYRTEEDIKAVCRQINSLPEKIKKENPRNYEGDYIIQSFCEQDKIYIVTSHFVQYNAAIKLLQQSYLLILAATIIISAILSYILARYISTPITRISYVTKKLSNLDFSNKVEVTGNDEIGELATNINILSDKLQHSIEKLKESIIIEKESRERQVQLFASMSHELKTPITILKGTLEGIKDQIGPYKNPLNYVDDMIEETNNMENIVLNLLSYAKFSVNDIKLSFQAYHLEDLIDDAISRLSYLIEEHEITLETNIVDDVVEVDQPSISMVLKNVLENAIFYSENKAKVEIFTSSFTDYVLIQIYNHGTNIAQENVIHIFEPFYRADNSRVRYKNGTGLGLTIVQQILDQHNSNYSMYNINNDDEYAVCFEFTLQKAKKKES